MAERGVLRYTLVLQGNGDGAATRLRAGDAAVITLVPLDPARHCLHRMGTGAGLYLCRRRAGHADGHEFLPLDMVSLAAPDPAIPSDNPIQKEPAPRVA